jgi:N-acetylglucosamine-6-phosphate deacetylase
MDRNLQVLRAAGAPVAELFLMAATVPAELLGLGPVKGALVAGAEADFAVYDDGLRCLATYLGGRRIAGAG